MIAESALEVEREPEPLSGRRVLVAEDSPITHDLLKLLLGQRGHHVDIASNGFEALEALRSHDYDVALLDYHLPGMDGAQIAAEIRRDHNRPLPRLVAITADMEGLLSDAGCENFDHIIPKPLDIYEIGKVVESQAEIADFQREASAAIRRPRAVAASVRQGKSFFESLDYNVLSWPDDLETDRHSARALQAALGDPRFDAIVIKEPAPADALSTIWNRKALHVLPVIDLTGTLGERADLDASSLAASDRDQLDRLFRRFQDQRAKLHKDLLFSDNPGEKLLARMFVSQRPLAAHYDLKAPGLISYNTIFSAVAVAREAETLRGMGFFKQSFFDRFHVCARCDSSRLHVREECPKCRSSDLVEESYLHHFSCAYQGPSSEFRSGDDLVCPKCKRALNNFGFDYDRPGTMLVCRSCKNAESEPAIGFVCLDCSARADSGSCGTRDAFGYHLTEQGLGFAQYGRSVLGSAQEALRFTELPMELVVSLNAAAKRYNEDQTPFTLINIFYEKEGELVAEHGARSFAQARDLFLENIRAALLQEDKVIKGQSYDFALLNEIGPEQSQRDFDLLRKCAQASVRFDLGAKFQAFGPEDIS